MAKVDPKEAARVLKWLRSSSDVLPEGNEQVAWRSRAWVNKALVEAALEQASRRMTWVEDVVTVLAIVDQKVVAWIDNARFDWATTSYSNVYPATSDENDPPKTLDSAKAAVEKALKES